MESGAFHGAGWQSGPVLIATSFRQRWKGLKPRANGNGMLIPGRSVHSWGMKDPLLIIGLDAQRCVVGFRALLPRRFACMPGASHILELPAEHMPPPHGSVLTWVDDGHRSLDPLRNPDRQPE